MVRLLLYFTAPPLATLTTLDKKTTECFIVAKNETNRK